jgi:molecular chaperone GrpE
VTQEKKPEPANPTESEGAPTGHAAAGEGPAADAAPQSEQSALADAQAEAARYKDQLLRTAADFDNFRKRSRRELEDAERRGRDELLKEFLPVFDNLERATSHAASTEATGGVKALAEGITLVIRQFTDTLRKIGIERIEAVGKPFDPSQHEAIQHLESADFPPGTVAAEVQAGYRSGERLVRPSLVVVAKRPSASADDAKPVDVNPGEPTPED